MQTAPYGSWASPITSELLVSAAVGFLSVAARRGSVYWLEARPLEGGRQVLMRRAAGGEVTEVTPAPFNARTLVHEYGGVPFVIADDGTAYCSSLADQRIYRLRPNQDPEPLTHGDRMRYADGVLDERRGLLYCVREDHSDPDREPVNTIVVIDLATGDESIVAGGNDFYSDPRLSPDGGQLCWLTWCHPNMPWDGTELWLASLDEAGLPERPVMVAGGLAESIFQPEWSPTGELYFVSDRTGWWNVHRHEPDGDQSRPVAALDADFASAAFVLGLRTYAFLSHGRVVCAFSQAGTWRLALLDPASGALRDLDLPLNFVASVCADGSTAYFVGAGATTSPIVYSLDSESLALTPLRESTSIALDPGHLSQSQPIEFPTTGGVSAHALYYAPTNADFRAPDGELPPLLVRSHGGPTSAARAALNLDIQFWTSRGFAVVDVNYGGSTGYGRPYRERLNGRWGVVDVDDCVNAARYLAGRGLVDPDRMAITGGSAGGYTTLCALTFHDTFRAGASHFGIGDLEALARDTHKFESRYLDSMVGPYPASRDLYVERSPINHVDGLSAAVIFFQGLEDKVVPPAQAEAMVAALERKGVPVAYLPFEGEQHGFRKAENIKRCIEAELYFYGRVFGFTPADDLDPVPITNL